MTEEERREQAREVLLACVKTRKLVESFIRISEEEEQSACDQEHIHLAFAHLYACNNTKEFELVIGSTAGSGLCGALWKTIKHDLSSFSDIVCEHTARIENPRLWQKRMEARAKDKSGIRPSILDWLLDKFLGWIFEQPSTQKPKEIQKEEQR